MCPELGVKFKDLKIQIFVVVAALMFAKGKISAESEISGPHKEHQTEQRENNKTNNDKSEI